MNFGLALTDNRPGLGVLSPPPESSSKSLLGAYKLKLSFLSNVSRLPITLLLDCIIDTVEVVPMVMCFPEYVSSSP